MVEDANKYADEDAKRRELIDARNAAEGIINDTEKNLTEFKDQIDQESMDDMRKRIAEVREQMEKSESSDEIKSIRSRWTICANALLKFASKWRKANPAMRSNRSPASSSRRHSRCSSRPTRRALPITRLAAGTRRTTTYRMLITRKSRIR